MRSIRWTSLGSGDDEPISNMPKFSLSVRLISSPSSVALTSTWGPLAPATAFSSLTISVLSDDARAASAALASAALASVDFASGAFTWSALSFGAPWLRALWLAGSPARSRPRAPASRWRRAPAGARAGFRPLAPDRPRRLRLRRSRVRRRRSGTDRRRRRAGLARRADAPVIPSRGADALPAIWSSAGVGILEQRLVVHRGLALGSLSGSLPRISSLPCSGPSGGALSGWPCSAPGLSSLSC